MIRSRKECLGGQGCDPTTLAEALHCLVEHSALDVADLRTALAQRFELHASRAYLYDLANPQRPDRGIRALALASALTAISGRGVLLRFLCRANGGEFVQLPAAVAGESDDARLAAETLAEFAEWMKAFAEGGADHVWAPAEVERLEREGHDAIERILQAIAHAKKQCSAAALPARAERMATAVLSTSAAKRRRA